MLFIAIILIWLLIRSLRHSPLGTSDVVLGIITIVLLLEQIF